MLNYPLKDVCGEDIGPRIHRANFDARTVLTTIIDDLANILVQLVDHQHGSFICSALRSNIIRPLLPGREFDVINSIPAVVFPILLGHRVFFANTFKRILVFFVFGVFCCFVFRVFVHTAIQEPLLLAPALLEEFMRTVVSFALVFGFLATL